MTLQAKKSLPPHFFMEIKKLGEDQGSSPGLAKRSLLWILLPVMSQKAVPWQVLTLAVALAGAVNSFGFALLGPYADWMQLTNGYRFPNDIGGPMDINEEYRWNAPVLTYAFDQSF